MRKVGQEIRLMGIQQIGLIFSQIENKKLVLRLAIQSNHSSMYGLRSTMYREGRGRDIQVVSIKKAADERRGGGGRQRDR